MELIQHLLPSQTNLSLKSWNLDTTEQQITLNVSSTQTIAHCPLCHCPTHRVHSRYERTLKDLPVAQFHLIIILVVGKFFCLNETCPQRIFTERLPAVVAAWARRTARYTDRLKAMVLSLGGAASARLSHQMGYGYSRNSLLRLIASLPLPALPTPRILYQFLKEELQMI